MIQLLVILAEIGTKFIKRLQIGLWEIEIYVANTDYSDREKPE